MTEPTGLDGEATRTATVRAVQRARRKHRVAQPFADELQDRAHRVDFHRDGGAQAHGGQPRLDEHPDRVRPARDDQREARQVAQAARGEAEQLSARLTGLELELAEQMARVQRVDFAAGSFPDRPEAHLELLVDTLESSGYPPYATPFDAAPPGISAAHVFVPGLERFMVVQLGRIVAPGRRGLDALSAERRGPAPRTRRETAALDRDFEGEGG